MSPAMFGVHLENREISQYGLAEFTDCVREVDLPSAQLATKVL